jgi:hypothetical protein
MEKVLGFLVRWILVVVIPLWGMPYIAWAAGWVARIVLIGVFGFSKYGRIANWGITLVECLTFSFVSIVVVYSLATHLKKLAATVWVAFVYFSTYLVWSEKYVQPQISALENTWYWSINAVLLSFFLLGLLIGDDEDQPAGGESSVAPQTPGR